MLVPLKESKTQRSITLPNRLWEFALQEPGVKSFTEGVRLLLEEAYQCKENRYTVNRKDKHETNSYS
jgi:hypothetical protein